MNEIMLKNLQANKTDVGKKLRQQDKDDVASESSAVICIESEDAVACANCADIIENRYGRGNEVFCCETCANDFNT